MAFNSADTDTYHKIDGPSSRDDLVAIAVGKVIRYITYTN